MNFIAKSGGDTDSNILFWTEAVGGSPTEKLRITSAGKVCINNDTAAADLHVCTAGSSEQDGILKLGGTDGTLGLVIDYDQSGTTVSKITSNPTYNNTGALLKLCVDGDLNSNQLVLIGSGNVGINDTDPSYKLNVAGDNTASNGTGMLKGIIGVQNDTTALGSSPTAGISFQTKYRTGPDVPLDVAAIWGGKENTSNGDKDGYMGFATREEGGSGTMERMRITSSGNVLCGNYFTSQQIGGYTSAIQIQGTDHNTSSLSLFRYTNDDGGAQLTLGKGRGTSGGAADKPNDADNIGSIRFVMANNNNLQDGNVARIDCNADGAPGGGDTPGRISFWLSPDGSSTPVENMRLTSGRNLLINCTSISGSAGRVYTSRGSSDSTTLEVNQNVGGSTEMITFRKDGSQLGTIHQSGSGVAYQSASDYRLKQDDVVISDGITRVKQLRPIRFKWKSDTDKTVDGFFAHEVSSVVPESVRGNKDEVFDTDGVGTQVKGGPKYQQLDQSKIIPLLTAALKEAIAKIETLEADVAALKSS
tara:strand:- start:37 stop:1632 length:1596 start_codon:yes stop_codon:yes gene_type:complete